MNAVVLEDKSVSIFLEAFGKWVHSASAELSGEEFEKSLNNLLDLYDACILPTSREVPSKGTKRIRLDDMQVEEHLL